MNPIFKLLPGQLSLSDIHFLINQHCCIALDELSKEKVHKSNYNLNLFLAKNRIAYGVNTGFGALANKVISNHELEILQKNLLMSHAAGVGNYLSNKVVKLTLLLKINSLSRGYSGVRYDLIDSLIKLYNLEVYPCIPSKGSVGASGDLSPLAHLGLCLLGEGKVRIGEEIYPALYGLEKANIKSFRFGPKEGLSLINGTQVSTALAIDALYTSQSLLEASIVACALTLAAVNGSVASFDSRIHLIRGQIGQMGVAKKLLNLLINDNRSIATSKYQRVQDPYCLRCQPQILGACHDQLQHAAGLLHIEANAVTDNPLIFSEEEILSGGNFHAEPVAMAADNIALALAEIGNLLERCVAMLVDPTLSGLPAFLVNKSGLNSGFMSAQITATALASENRALAHPAVVDNIPTGANQEDHVSMATFAARRLSDMNSNLTYIVAIHLLASCQGIGLRSDIELSKPLKDIFNMIRKKVGQYEDDRCISDDIEIIAKLVSEVNWNQKDHYDTNKELVSMNIYPVTESLSEVA
jgi:histidine ammonia-lyase